VTSEPWSRRVIFINRYFYPDHAATAEILSSLAFELVSCGFDVHVITSRLRYDDTSVTLRPWEVIHGVSIWRIWTSRRGRQNLIGRSLDYFSFYLFAGWQLLRIARAGDVVVAMTDPPLLSVVAAPIAWLRRLHLVNWLQDIFPEVAEALRVGGSAGSLAFRLLRPLRNRSLQAADINVVVGHRMADHLVEESIPRRKIRVIENWSDGEFISPTPASESELRRSWGLQDAFVIGYAGNLGRVHDLVTVITAMVLLQERAARSEDDISNRIKFVFIGGGAQFPELEREVSQRGLRNVLTRPYQRRERLSQTLAVADVHLVTLNPKLEGLVMPSKFYGVLAAGRPVLFVGAGQGELAKLVQEIGCGLAVKSGHGMMLMESILELASDLKLCARMGFRGREAFEERWSKGRAIEKWTEALNSIASRPDQQQESNCN
jgi:colanic acid biosynthesis glycosyl transferase WcaI